MKLRLTEFEILARNKRAVFAAGKRVMGFGVGHVPAELQASQSLGFWTTPRPHATVQPAKFQGSKGPTGRRSISGLHGQSAQRHQPDVEGTHSDRCPHHS